MWFNWRGQIPDSSCARQNGPIDRPDRTFGSPPPADAATVGTMEHDAKYQNSLCLAYLGGFGVKNSRGLPSKEYFADGSKDEWEARETLAFLLRNQEPLSRELREVLAALFEPQPSPLAHPAGVREVRLRKRKQGRTKNDAAATEIAKYVYDKAQAGKPVNAAKADAALQFEMDERTIGKIWSAYKPGILEIWGPIRRRTK
jgi:hypothetical protein